MESNALVASPGTTIVIAPPGVARVDAGRRLASRLIADSEAERRLVLRGVHPDLIEVIPPGGKEKIGIDQVRAVIRAGQFAPVQGKRKVCVIPHGEALTPEAENSLLKVLEEPSRELSFVILVGEAQDLLPTIRSRGRIVRLPAPGAATLLAQLRKLGYEEEEANYLLTALSGEELAPFLQERMDVRALRARAHSRAQQAEISELSSLSGADNPIERYEAIVWLLLRIAPADPVSVVRAARGLAEGGRTRLAAFFATVARVTFFALRRGLSVATADPELDRLFNFWGLERLLYLSRAAEEARRAVEGYTPGESVTLWFMLELKKVR